MVGTDFLALVRFGLRSPDDPRILSTLAVTDALLRTDTPNGPVWHRYTGDGYGEHADGSPFDGTGIGRGWPLLVGERGHYELDAGRDARPYLEAMRRLGSAGGMLPEQVWDAATSRPAASSVGPAQRLGDAARLGARRVREARAVHRARPRDRPPRGGLAALPRGPAGSDACDVALRRAAARRWSRAERSASRLLAPCRVRCSLDGWRTTIDVDARDTGLGVWVADVPGSDALAPGRAVDATFYWPDADRWEGRNVRVSVEPG